MANILFPFSASTSWFSKVKAGQCPPQISEWLFDQQSLTKKLEGLYRHFHVQVRQQIIIDTNQSSLSNYFTQDTKRLVREVFLYCDNRPVIFAQTEIPFNTLTEQQAQLSEIGTQSLGNILFNDPTMKRGKIEAAQFTDKSKLALLSPQIEDNYNHPLWARRSLFYLNNNPLLVTELFLPASSIYLT